MSDHLPASFSLASTSSQARCATRKDPDSERLAKDNPEMNRTTMKPKTVSQQAAVLLAALTLLLSAGRLSQYTLLKLCQHVCLLGGLFQC